METSRVLATTDPNGMSVLFANLSEQIRRQARTPNSLRIWMDLAESWRILEALRNCRGNRSAAARELGIGRRTLYTKMERLGIAGEGDTRAESATPRAALSHNARSIHF